MATTDYATVAELEEYLLGASKNQVPQQGNFAIAVTAASRNVNEYCGRRFWIDDAETERIFTVDDPAWFFVPDIATLTGLIVASDDNEDGTFEETWTINQKTERGFEMYPYNAQTDPDVKRPYTKVESNAYSFPTFRRGVSVTAKWGWPAVPGDVKQAVLIHAARFWKRKDAVLGQGGNPETGTFEMKRTLDPDVRRILSPYRNFQQ